MMTIISKEIVHHCSSSWGSSSLISILITTLRTIITFVHHCSSSWGWLPFSTNDDNHFNRNRSLITNYCNHLNGNWSDVTNDENNFDGNYPPLLPAPRHLDDFLTKRVIKAPWRQRWEVLLSWTASRRGRCRQSRTCPSPSPPSWEPAWSLHITASC